MQPDIIFPQPFLPKKTQKNEGFFSPNPESNNGEHIRAI